MSRGKDKATKKKSEKTLKERRAEKRNKRDAPE
ncbi:Small EDRK-rich factor 2 [Edwardsiella anguillarum]|nr:Small EDRK-rich factor 2 [Edwardsiella anguillarum]BET87641.1 Small EDRK-rich factor 2 [Edwardsiella anguillarum]BET91068.1 Small EDRK-rich factor 2 [Edwardsiella anguillarum]